MTYGTAKRLAGHLQEAQAKHPNTILLVAVRMAGGLPAIHSYQVEVTIHGARVIFTGSEQSGLAKLCALMQEIQHAPHHRIS